MSTAAVSSSSLYQQLQSYFQQRQSDVQQLGQALQSGDLAGAQQEFTALQTLGQSGPFANGNDFKNSQRQQDFNAIGQALQSGDLAGAQQAFAQLQSSFRPQQQQESSASQPAAASSTATASEPEIVLNLGTVTPGEQITIGLSSASNGSEQVTIGVANQQNQAPEQITLNLNPNSNQEIILNLLNSAASTSSSTTAQSSGLNVTA
jgi:acetyl/propionyl-CoA carboxylase alpha subunit